MINLKKHIKEKKLKKKILDRYIEDNYNRILYLIISDKMSEKIKEENLEVSNMTDEEFTKMEQEIEQEIDEYDIYSKAQYLI